MSNFEIWSRRFKKGHHKLWRMKRHISGEKSHGKVLGLLAKFFVKV